MVEVGKLSQKNLAQALRAATDLAVPYLTEGYSFYLHADLGPTWEERGREPTWFQLASAGRVPRNRALQEVLQGKNPQIMDPKLREELKADPWRTGLSDLVPVRRCWGVQGLFWALLIDRLEGERGFTTCLRCQRILPGPRERCGSRDDRTCHKAQAAERQRRARRRR
jgi:hypothetical protein